MKHLIVPLYHILFAQDETEQSEENKIQPHIKVEQQKEIIKMYVRIHMYADSVQFMQFIIN